MRWILTATELDEWSKMNPRRAQEILPELIAKLILASTDKIIQLTFPIEKGIQYPGYDGVLVSEEQTNFFPKDKSVWEFGTNEDAKAKFEDDIKKRSENPLGVDMENTVFIFATLKIWNHKKSIEEIINESKTEYPWKDIQIYDASKITLWLFKCPAVVLWLSKVIGKHIQNIRFLEDYWEDYCLSTTPHLTTEFFLEGREQNREKLLKWSKVGSGFNTIIAESKLEALLFIIACFLSVPEEESTLLNRAMIVTSQEAWNTIVEQHHEGILLIPMFNFSEEFMCTSDLFVLLPVGKYSIEAKLFEKMGSIVLANRKRDVYFDLLKTLGYDLEECSKIGEYTKRRFLPFYRMITNVPMRKKPGWVDKQNTSILISALLAGTWSGAVEGDKEIIEKLSGMSYDQYLKDINEWMCLEDAPLFSVLNTYRVVSVQDMWDFLFEFMTEETVQRLRECVKEVFNSTHPMFELPKEQWFMASALGKKSKYSEQLKRGLIVSLVMLTEKDGQDNNMGILSTATYVDNLVKEVLAPITSWQEWRTVAPELIYFAEASPKAFIERIESEVAKQESEIWNLFEPSGDFLSGRNDYTYILWALETLVWNEKYIAKAVFVLAQICEKAFEYKMVNSPENTLYEIFCLWHPQHCLEYRKGLDLFKHMLSRYPVAGWKVLQKLLEKNGACGNIQKPRWLNLESEFERKVLQYEYLEAVNELKSVVLKNANGVLDRWIVIIENIDLFENEYQQLEIACAEFCCTLEDVDVIKICDLLRKAINKSRMYPHEDWTICKEYADKLESLYDKILPEGSIRYKYLFEYHPDILYPEKYGGANQGYFEEKRDQVHTLRINAVDSIYEKDGLEGLLSFAELIEDIDVYGNILVDKEIFKDIDLDLLQRVKNKNNKLFGAIMKYLITDDNTNELFVLLSQYKKISNEKKAEFLCQVPFSKAVWKNLEGLDKNIVDSYWGYVNIWRMIRFDKAEQEYVLEQLISHNRPYSALNAISFTGYDNAETIMRILEKCLEMKDYQEFNGMNIKSIRSYDVLELFKVLYKNRNIDDSRLIRLEIAFLPFFRDVMTPKGLINHLEEHPEDYILFITMAYKSDDRKVEEEKTYAIEQRKTAYKVLEAFRRVPWCNEVRKSEPEFIRWMDSAKEFAKLQKHGEAFDILSGKLLSYSPMGEDRVFPHEYVRNYIEKGCSERMKQHFIIEKINQRGVFRCSAGEEGKKISEKYYQDAKKIRLLYPYTADLLNSLGDEYNRSSLYEQKQEEMEFYF